jgi:hypothetical protein
VGSTIEFHRKQIREALGFRESTRVDEDKLIEWLAEKICPEVLTDEGFRAALLRRCRTKKIEPPGRIERILGSARRRFEREFGLRGEPGAGAVDAGGRVGLVPYLGEQ